MILRYKVGFMEHIIDAERVEIEDVGTAEVKNGKWLFKCDPLQSICKSCRYEDACGTERISCDGYDTYTTGHNERETEVTIDGRER